MNKGVFKFRWINDSCYEFKLPDGRILTTDPYLDRHHTHFSVDDMSVPDFVFITHTHYDHIMELGDVMAKNDAAKLFVSEITASPLMDYFDIKFGQVFGVTPGHKLTIDGIDILPTCGKHSRFKVRQKEYQSFLKKLTADECGATDIELLTSLGSTVYTDFLLTLPYNIRIFLTGGDMMFSTPYEVAREHAPLIVIRQVSNLDSPEVYADIVARLGGTIVLPHHQEYPERRLGMPMPEFVDRVNARLAEIAPGMVMVNPEQYKWYELSLGVSLV